RGVGARGGRRHPGPDPGASESGAAGTIAPEVRLEEERGRVVLVRSVRALAEDRTIQAPGGRGAAAVGEELRSPTVGLTTWGFAGAHAVPWSGSCIGTR